MSKILNATCSNQGKVTADGVEVPDVVVLSEGNQASSGLLILDQDRKTYVTSSATDIKTTIEKLIATLTDLNSALTTIAGTFTSIGAGMTGPTTAPPPTLPTDVLSITAKVTSLEAVKTELTALKDALK